MHAATVETYSRPQVAEKYASQCAPYWDNFPQDIFRKIKANMPGEGLVADIGCGPGNAAAILAGLGLRVVGVDIAPPMLRMTQKRGIDAIRANFFTLPFGDGKLAGAFAFTSLIHAERCEFVTELMPEIKRTLQKGAVLGLGMIEGRGENISTTYGGKRLITYYELRALRNLLAGLRFDVFLEYRSRNAGSTYLTLLAKRK